MTIRRKPVPPISIPIEPFPRAEHFSPSIAEEDLPTYSEVPEDAKSFCSDEVVPPSSPTFDPVPEFNISKTFPAILKPLELLHRALKTRDVSTLRSVAVIFSHNLRAVIDSMDRLPLSVQQLSAYQATRHGVIFTKHLFKIHVKNMPLNASGPALDVACQLSSQLLDMTMSSLKEFLLLAENELQEAKSLPELPPDNPVKDPGNEFILDSTLNGLELATTGDIIAAPVGDVLHPKELTLDDPSTSKPTTPRKCAKEVVKTVQFVNHVKTSTAESSSNFTKSKFKEKAGGIRAVEGASVVSSAILQRKRTRSLLSLLKGSSRSKASKGSRASIHTTATKSTLTLVDLQSDSDSNLRHNTESESGSSSSLVSEARNIRASLALFPNSIFPRDPIAILEEDEDEHCTLYNEEGFIAATLPALVRMLTSMDAIAHDGFADTFFVTFRFFCSPTELVQHLIARYDAKAPSGLTEAHKALWDAELGSTRLRVAKTIYLWIHMHWRRDTDSELFDSLVSLASRIVEDVPGLLSTQVLSALFDYARYGSSYRGGRLARRAELAEMSMPVRHYHPTYFEFPLAADLMPVETSPTILSFRAGGGIEEFARQLTIMSSTFFRKLDPEDAVNFWCGGNDKEVGKRITALIANERALTVWVTKTILEKSDPKARAVIIACFIELATRCVWLGNFGSGFSVYSGLRETSVERLLKTINKLSPQYIQQRDTLDKLFSPSSNYSLYRASLRVTKPCVPLIFPFIHDLDVFQCQPAWLEHPQCPGRILINFQRYRKIAKTLESMELCHVPYKLVPNQPIQEWILRELGPYVEADMEEHNKVVNEMYARSCLLEPKNQRSIQTLRQFWQNKIKSYLPLR